MNNHIFFYVAISDSIAGIRRYKYWQLNLSEICTPRILQIVSKECIKAFTDQNNNLSYFVVYILQSLFTFFNICQEGYRNGEKIVCATSGVQTGRHCEHW